MAKDPSASIAQLEAYLQGLTAHSSPPGMSISVVRGHTTVYSNGFGLADGPRRVPAAADSVYHWWSMTKTVTAVCVLQLQERGLLSIDRPVATYLPYFQARYPSGRGKAITLRHLLNHSSGMPDTLRVMGWIHAEDEPPFNQTELLKSVLPRYSRLKVEPGKESWYTNIGYMVLGAIIEAVSGLAYEEYVRQHILRPLKMQQTDFCYSEDMKGKAAVGSHPLLNMMTPLLPFLVKGLGRHVREIRGGKIWFNRLYNDQTPPSGLIGPVTDVVRFLMAYLNGGELDGGRILSPATVNLMTNEAHVPTGKGLEERFSREHERGLGWVIAPDGDTLILSHGGGGAGFGCLMRVYPGRSLGMAVMANDTTIDCDAILDRVALVAW